MTQPVHEGLVLRVPVQECTDLSGDFVSGSEVLHLNQVRDAGRELGSVLRRDAPLHVCHTGALLGRGRRRSVVLTLHETVPGPCSRRQPVDRAVLAETTQE